MARLDADRNLLFGILALQMDFITRDDLIGAMGAWVLEKGRPLADLLEARGTLAAGDRALLEPLVLRHIEQHDGDPARSLASLSSVEWLRGGLAPLAGTDPDVHASLDRLSRTREDTEATAGAPPGGPAGPRFRILRPHARGGLGEVFVARDEELHREVALKQIQGRHADHPESRSRFLLEAEVTGGLEHPGIVPVYSLGHDPDGRPFYAMRFIRGDSLKGAIERFHQAAGGGGLAGDRMLEFQKLLRRFLDVCNAVAYAHSRGVLHRDLKPGNVMVGPFGETLVVDWGLAKVVGRSEPSGEATLRPPSASGSSETMPGSAIGTPAFMSPEQAEGRIDRLGPASDVYSLGATLYCLLTGRAPIEGTGIAVEEVLRRVRSGEFPAPRQARPEVPRALEAICLKAMALRPEDRYGSPRDLADDIEHWLADEPVTARREPLVSRALRWARRHRPAVAVALAILLTSTVALTISTAAISRKQRETDDARRRAESSFRQAQGAVDRYLREIAENRLLNVPGLQPLRKDLLRAAREFYEEFVGERGEDPTVRAELATAYMNLGQITGETGSRQESVDLYLRARPILAALARERPGDPELPSRLAKLDASLGRLYVEMGRMTDAERAYGDALERANALVKDRPESMGFRRLQGSILNHSHRVYRALGDPDRHEAALSRALEVRAGLVRDDPKSDEDRANLAETRGYLGDFHARRNQLERGIGLLRESIAEWDALAGEHPHDQRFASALANNLLNLGMIESGVNRKREAAGPLERALGIRERLARENPTVVNYRHDLAVNLGYLADVHGALGQGDRAIATFRRAQEVWESLVRELPESADMRHGLAFALYAQGAHQFEAGHNEEAQRLLRKAVEIYEGLARENPQQPRYQEAVASTELALARLYSSSGRLAEARPIYRGALRRIGPILRASPKNPMMQSLRVECAIGLARLGDHAAAAAEAEATLALVEPSGLNLYNLACAFSLARRAALADATPGRPGRERLAESYGARAIELLTRALAAGYFDQPDHAASLGTDADLEAIRPLDGFKALASRVSGLRRNPKP